MPRTFLALAFLFAATPAFTQKVTTRILKIERLQTSVPAQKTWPLPTSFDAPAGASTLPPAQSPSRSTFARGASLNLQLPDGRIATATCTSVHEWDVSIERYRDCRIPPYFSTPVQAKFGRTHARLTWPTPWAKHKTISETYTLVSITPPPAIP